MHFPQLSHRVPSFDSLHLAGTTHTNTSNRYTRRHLGVVSKMGHSLAAKQKWSHMVLITHSSSGVQLQAIVNAKWSLKRGRPTKNGHVCKTMPGHSTLVTNRLLYLFQNKSKQARLIILVPNLRTIKLCHVGWREGSVWGDLWA